MLYFAHPVFEAYNKSGNYVLERYISGAIESFCEKHIEVKNLPSSGKIRLREGNGFLALHVLYAPPINRGNVCLLPDFPKLYEVEVSLKTDRNITSVKTAPCGVEIPFVQKDGKVFFTLPPFRLHELVILE